MTGIKSQVKLKFNPILGIQRLKDYVSPQPTGVGDVEGKLGRVTRVFGGPSFATSLSLISKPLAIRFIERGSPGTISAFVLFDSRGRLVPLRIMNGFRHNSDKMEVFEDKN